MVLDRARETRRGHRGEMGSEVAPGRVWERLGSYLDGLGPAHGEVGAHELPLRDTLDCVEA